MGVFVCLCEGADLLHKLPLCWFQRGPYCLDVSLVVD